MRCWHRSTNTFLHNSTPKKCFAELINDPGGGRICWVLLLEKYKFRLVKCKFWLVKYKFWLVKYKFWLLTTTEGGGVVRNSGFLPHKIGFLLEFWQFSTWFSLIFVRNSGFLPRKIGFLLELWQFSTWFSLIFVRSFGFFPHKIGFLLEFLQFSTWFSLIFSKKKVYHVALGSLERLGQLKKCPKKYKKLS